MSPTTHINEAAVEVENTLLDWLREIGYTTAHEPDLAPGDQVAEWADRELFVSGLPLHCGAKVDP